LEDHLDSQFSNTSLLGALTAVFDRQEWPYEVRNDVLMTAPEGLPMYFSADERLGIILLIVPIAPGKGMQGYTAPARPEAELSAAVYMLSANYRLPYGHFTRDHSDGEIRFESSLMVADGDLTDDQVAGMMLTAVAAIAQHGKAILDLYTGKISLKQALTKLESRQGGGSSDIQVA
jgi:hypothetical protein